MDFTALHGYVIGFSVIGSWLVVMVLALVLRLARKDDVPWFWRIVSVAQILLALQLLVGLGLLVAGRRPAGEGLGTLLFHLSYGVITPLVVLVFAHKWARDGRIHPLSAFALVGLVNFGLTFRAFQVGAFGA